MPDGRSRSQGAHASCRTKRPLDYLVGAYLARLARPTSYAWPALGIAAALLLVNTLVDHSFLHPDNWASILAVAMPFVIVAMAAIPALLSGSGDPRAAFTSGVQVETVRIVAYVTGGVLAAAAGFAFTIALGSGDPLAANAYTLIGIAGAVLGGVSLSGGRGGLLGAAAGGSVLFLVQNLLSLAHVFSFYTQVAYGVILILALALNSAGTGWRRRRERASLVAFRPLIAASTGHVEPNDHDNASLTQLC